MDTAFRGLGKKSKFQGNDPLTHSTSVIVERIAKDSLLSQNSTSSMVAPPPAVTRSPPLPPPPPAPRTEKYTKKKVATPAPKAVPDNNDSSSCSSPSSSSENEDQTSDIENEDPQPSLPTSSANKRARADATSTESLSPPRDSTANSTRMMLRSSARRQHQSTQQIPVSTPSFRQQRKHRRIDLDLTPLNTTNNKKKLPPTQSSTPQINK